VSVQVLCPSCGDVAEHHRPPVTECVRCHTPLPEPLRLSTERALARELAPKPLLLVLGQWLSLIVGSVFLLMLPFAVFDMGTFTIGADAVSGPEFLRRAGWMFALIGGLLLGIGVGLWRERSWVRPLMVGYWLAFVLIAVVSPDDDGQSVALSVVMGLAAAGVAAWYVYAKTNVRAYFETRAGGDTARASRES
jgi:hypothetical protein